MVAALKILHIAFAAAWFGHKLLVPSDIKAAVASLPSGKEEFLRRLTVAERLGQVSGTGTLVAGLALAVAIGPSTVGTGVWIGAGLVMAAIVLGATTGRPAAIRLRSAVSVDDREAATIAGIRLSLLLAVESTLWVGALIAMVIG